MSKEEKKNKKWGLGISIGLHVIILALLFFLVAWKRPYPPPPAYGIELNFGLDDRGTGETQSTPATNNNESTEETEEEEIVEEESAVKETQETVEVPDTESPDQLDPQEEEISNEEKVEELVEAKNNENTELSDNESEEAESANTEDANSHGDDADETGDKGKPEGTIDEAALYNSAGNGSGASLEMAGWNWDFVPKPDDQSQERGKIVFEIKIDSEGEIIGVRVLESTIRPVQEKIYREEVQKLTFYRTAGNNRPPPTSTGKITFIIQAK